MAREPAVSPFSVANVRRFLIFRVTFNSRFYYPVFTILFLDFGLTLSQFALLNVVWAASIMLLEIPSGALADTMGRRNLLVLAGALMVVELAIICLVPLGNPRLVFAAFLVNRILSGAAEAAASGADEALAYDSLAREGNAEDWGRVLDWQLRTQSIGFVVALSLGAVAYDPAMMQWVVDRLGLDWTVTQRETLRLPLYLTLILALVTLGTTLRMTETPSGDEGEERSVRGAAIRAFRLTLDAGAWIARTPFALAAILFGMLFDHVTRMFITLNSQYYRIIDLPEASFGLIGSAMAMVGIFIPRAALWLAERRGPAFNTLLLGAIGLVGFVGVSQVIPYWGLAPVVLLSIVMNGQRFFVSHYLNAVTDSRQRATVLSFRGLSFNLAYGAIGLMYSGLLAVLEGRLDPEDFPMAHGSLEDAAFIASLEWFAPYFAILFAAFWIYSWRRMRAV